MSVVAKAEQIPRHSYLSKSSARKARRSAKERLRRIRRRAEARDPENAPVRFTRGWAD